MTVVCIVMTKQKFRAISDCQTTSNDANLAYQPSPTSVAGQSRFLKKTTSFFDLGVTNADEFKSERLSTYSDDGYENVVNIEPDQEEWADKKNQPLDGLILITNCLADYKRDRAAWYELQANNRRIAFLKSHLPTILNPSPHRLSAESSTLSQGAILMPTDRPQISRETTSSQLSTTSIQPGF